MNLKDELKKIAEYVLADEPLKKHTTFRIGGNADYLIEATSISEIKNVISFCKKNNIPYFVMGNGSNLLVSDKGIRGVVIKTSGRFNKTEVCDNKIKVSSGVLMSKIANRCKEEGLKGFCALSGIPGTIGGAIYMNAGAYGSEIKDVISDATYLDDRGEIKTVKKDDMDLSYRHSFFSDKDYIILEATLSLERGNIDEIKEKMKEYTKKRCDKQPLNYPSGGSTFKRPEGYFAAKLIDDCGLKGKKIGGAMVSKKHCGFIINYDNASFNDVVSLIKYVEKDVFEKTNVMLKPEIKIIGEDE